MTTRYRRRLRLRRTLHELLPYEQAVHVWMGPEPATPAKREADAGTERLPQCLRADEQEGREPGTGVPVHGITVAVALEYAPATPAPVYFDDGL